MFFSGSKTLKYITDKLGPIGDEDGDFAGQSRDSSLLHTDRSMNGWDSDDKG